MLMLDFAKAYDRVSFTFLQRVLQAIGIPCLMVNLIMSMYVNARAALVVNGTQTRWWRKGRGVLQGCPLAPFLFTLIVEALARWLPTVYDTRGIDLGGGEPLWLSQFADDSTLWVRTLREGVELLQLIQGAFCAASNMRLNASKTMVLIIGEGCIAQDTEAIKEAGFKCINSEPHQGRWLGLYPAAPYECPTTWGPLIEKIRGRLARLCKGRWLHLRARTMLASSTALSCMWYRATGASARMQQCKIIQRVNAEFIWAGQQRGELTGARHVTLVGAAVTTLPLREGGLNMMETSSMVQALGLFWWHRYWKAPEGALWKRVIDAMVREIQDGRDLGSLMHSAAPLKKDLPQFWSDVIRQGRRLWPDCQGPNSKKRSVAQIRRTLLASKYATSRRIAARKLVDRWEVNMGADIDWKVAWATLNSVYVPQRVADTVWRILRGGVYSKNKLSHFLNDGNDTCILCRGEPATETPEHVMSECSGTKQVWIALGTIVGRWIGCEARYWGWLGLWQFTCASRGNYKGWPWVVRLCLLATIHQVWQHRTDIMYKGATRNMVGVVCTAVDRVRATLGQELHAHRGARLSRRGLNQEMWGKMVAGTRWEWIRFDFTRCPKPICEGEGGSARGGMDLQQCMREMNPEEWLLASLDE